ncbi:hypothetical protein MMC10_010969 [Thelotrema lepadinum]|nr:hypothetical protein [Thelotrema lepadinum]
MERSNEFSHNNEDGFNETSCHALLSSPEVVLELPSEDKSDRRSHRRYRTWLPKSWHRWVRTDRSGTSYMGLEKGEESQVEVEETNDAMSDDTMVEDERTESRRHILMIKAYRAWVWMLPSFLHRFLMTMPPSNEVRRSTDYLDGIRGVASLFVFLNHYLVQIHPGFTDLGYGHDPDSHSVFQLPIIRLFYSGATMVAIFFIVSGYVLSHRCIVAIRQRKDLKLYSALASMTFRRGIRLFFPCIAISLIVLMAVFLGWIPSKLPYQQWSAAAEIMNYMKYLDSELFRMWVWGVSYQGYYSYQLWTIPVEFKCSLILFLQILLVSQCRASVRLTINTLMTSYLFMDKRWDIALFIYGLLLAEVTVIYSEKQERRAAAADDLSKPLQLPRRASIYMTCLEPFLWAAMVLGCYIGSYPTSDAANTPGYAWLALMWKDDDWEWKMRFWLAVSSILIVSPVCFLPMAQRFFTTGVARYLGKISFGLYLVHGFLNRSFRLWLRASFWKALHYMGHKHEGLRYDEGWILATFLYVPAVFWFADVFTRAVDGPTVKFTKWVEMKCFRSSKS